MIKRLSNQVVFTACATALVGISLSACNGFKARHYTPQEVKAYLQKVADEQAADPNPENAPVAPAPEEPAGGDETKKTDENPAPTDGAQSVTLDEPVKVDTTNSRGALNELLTVGAAALAKKDEMHNKLVRGVNVTVSKADKILSFSLKAVVDLGGEFKIVQSESTSLTFPANGSLTPMKLTANNVDGTAATVTADQLVITGACVSDKCEMGLVQMKFQVTDAKDAISVYLLVGVDEARANIFASNLTQVLTVDEGLNSLNDAAGPQPVADEKPADVVVTTSDPAANVAANKNPSAHSVLPAGASAGFETPTDVVKQAEAAAEQAAAGHPTTHSVKPNETVHAATDGAITGAGASVDKKKSNMNKGNATGFATPLEVQNRLLPKTASQREDDRVGRGSAPTAAPAKAGAPQTGGSTTKARKCKRASFRGCMEWEK